MFIHVFKNSAKKGTNDYSFVSQITQDYNFLSMI